MAESIQQTADGGYIVAGHSNSPNSHDGSFDYWIMKLNAAGDAVEWERFLGGSGREGGTTDEGSRVAIRQTSDGGYIFAGHSDSPGTSGDLAIDNTGGVYDPHGGYDYWVVKLDALEVIEWEKSYGGSGIDLATDIIEMPDGGYIILGASTSNDENVTGHHGPDGPGGTDDYWLVKVDVEGNIEWQKSLSGPGNEGGNTYLMSSLIVTEDGYSLAGFSGNSGSRDFYVVKLDALVAIPVKPSIVSANIPKTLTIYQGDGKSTSVTFYANDTYADIARKINDAIADGLGQGQYVSDDSNFCTIADGTPGTSESVVTKKISPVYAENGTVIGYKNYATLLIRSAVPGAGGELHFSGDEDLLKTLGLSTIQESQESTFRVSVHDAHSGEILERGPG